MTAVPDLSDLVAAARASQERKDFGEAVRQWQRCLRLAPDHPDRVWWTIFRAQALFDRGRQALGIAVLRRLARRHPDRAEAIAHLALLYQRAGAHDLAVPLWHDLLERFPGSDDRRWWLPCAAFSLLDLGSFETAEELCNAAISAFPASAGGYNALSAICERRFHWERAEAAIGRALELCDGDARVPFIVSKLRVLTETGDIAACESVLAVELARAPHDIRVVSAAADLARTEGPSAEALRRWDHCLAAFPDAPEAYLGKAQMLRKLGDARAARDLLVEACARWPRDAALHQGLGEAAAQLRDMAGARQAWQQAERLAPLSVYRLWAQCAFLGSCGARTEADALLVRRDASGNVLLRARYEYAKAARELDSALAILGELRTASPSDAVLAFAEAEIRSWRQDEGDLEAAARLLQDIVAASPASVRALVLLARVLVLLERPGDAMQVIAAMPAADGRRGVSESRLWVDASRSDWPAVAMRWQAHEQRFFLPALHLPPAGLRLVGARFTPPAAGGIIAMSMVRNELPRLPMFLDHHRALGVDGFVIVDNASQDGTAEFLAGQPDVRLYQTAESFSQSHFGMRWLNQIIDLHGRGWVLYADADERLVFPGSERRTLIELTAYLAGRNEQVVPGIMIDMFPDNAGRIGELAHWFDPPRPRPFMSCPYREAAGGARRRLFGTTVALGKAPLINAAAGVRYLGSHTTTPAPVSGVTAAMLHHHLDYLFDPEQTARMEEEAARAEHSDHAIDRRRMLSLMTGRDGIDMRGPESLRYEGTRQLLHLGLITTTDAFESLKAA